MKRWITSALLASLIMASHAHAGLEAGAAVVDISPLKLPAIRNGSFVQKTADRVDDPLFARALAFRSGTETVAICVVDSCMVPTDVCDAIKQLVTQQTGLPMARILISSTHTHSAPSVMEMCLGTRKDEIYTAQMIPQVAESIVKALAALAPAKAGWAQVDAHDFTHCRRWIRRPDMMDIAPFPTDPFGKVSSRANMHPGHENPGSVGPSGPTDPQLTVLSVVRADNDAPIALLANFSMHYFGAGPGFSADFFGEMAGMLERELGSGAIGIVAQGTSGDLQFIDYSQPRKKGVTRTRYADGLAKIALDAMRGIRHEAELPLAMEETKLPLSRRVPSEERLAWAAPINAARGDALPKNLPEVYAEQAAWIHENPRASLVLQAMRLGDLGITAMPNEVYAITGLKLKKQSPLPATMNIGLANGAEGYIPPPEQHQLGGYTTWPARTAGLEESAEPKIVEAVLGLLEKASGKPRRVIDDGVSPYSTAVLNDAPLAYWRLNDLSGPQPREATGKASATWEPGVAYGLPGVRHRGGEISAEPEKINPFTPHDINRAAHVAGGRLRAHLPALGRNYSAELWVWNGLPADARRITGYLFSRGPDADPAAPGEHLGIGGNHPATKPGRLFFYNGNQAGETLCGETQFTFRDWHHIVMVRENDRLIVYLDGKKEIDGSAAWTLPDGAHDVFLGGRSDRLFGLEGKLDEVALYPVALSAAQVEAHFKAAERSAPDAVADSYQVGVCAYTFRQFTAFEAIDKTKEAGGEVIEFFLWQKLSPEHPDVILDENLADEHIAVLKAKLESAGIKAVNAYFSDAAFKDPAQVEERLHRLFGFARKLGLRGLTGEPPADQLDLVEKMVKEYDIQLCFHNHPKDPKRPDYRNWDPAYLLSLMDGRDPRMGFSLDVGHIVRSGLDPVEAVRLCGKRLHSVHLKDVKEAASGAPDGPYGEGVGNLMGVLAELKNQGFSGHVAVECDRIPEPLMEGVARNIAFIRKH